MSLRSSLKQYCAVLLCASLFAATVQHLKSVPKLKVHGEIEIALPLFVQVALAAGDRYLAGNIAAIRAMVVDARYMQPGEYAVLAKVQEDVSWLNPRNEDNFYIAAAILPWAGYVDAAQIILERAMLTRPYDYQPAFYYAFDLYHFKSDPSAASAALRSAVLTLPDDDARTMLENLAAQWMDQTANLDTAIAVVEAMAKSANKRSFGIYLEMRAKRLRMLKEVRQAAAVFEQRNGRPIQNLNELVESGVMSALPADPFGFGFYINRQGRILLIN